MGPGMVSKDINLQINKVLLFDFSSICKNPKNEKNLENIYTVERNDL